MGLNLYDYHGFQPKRGYAYAYATQSTYKVSSQFDNSVFLTILDPIKELEGAPQKP